MNQLIDKIGLSLSPRVLLLLILTGTALFYLPFLSNQFLSDDWLWLSAASDTASNPQLLLERPVLDYYRPLNLAIFLLLLKSVGLQPYLFSLLSILLHIGNTYLLWKVLNRFRVEASTKIAAVVIFAFYVLNFATITWISSAPDIWVTGFSLLFVLGVIGFIENPGVRSFTKVLIPGFAAILFKESGLITIGIFFLLFRLMKESSFAKKYRMYSLILVCLYLIYFLIYFLTRTSADRELSICIKTLSNLWYFLAYIATPVSKQIALSLPDGFQLPLKVFKIGVILALPLLSVFIWRKSNRAVKLFMGWSIMFVSTIAVFRWNMGLFDLYPNVSISRFFYSATVGYSVVLGWLWTACIGKRLNFVRNRYLPVAVAILFTVGNLLATIKISRTYFVSQHETSQIIEHLNSIKSQLSGCDSLIVITDDLEKTPQIIYWPGLLEGMIHTIYGERVHVSVEEREIDSSLKVDTSYQCITLIWDTNRNQFITARR